MVVAGDCVVEESKHVQEQHTQTQLHCSTVAGRPGWHLVHNLYTTATVYNDLSKTFNVQQYTGLRECVGCAYNLVMHCDLSSGNRPLLLHYKNVRVISTLPGLASVQ